MMIHCSGCERATEHVSFFEGGKDWEYGVPGSFNQSRCTVCGLVAMVPMPSLEEILTFYPNTYHGYQAATSPVTRWLIERNLRQRARVYKALIGSHGMILDVGAADGAHFDIWKTEGAWEFAGFEFNPEIAADARAQGRDVATATIETFDARGRTFDLIIMNHLLEHVQDPLDTMRRAVALLKPGGYLVGEVPSLKSIDRWMFGNYWGGCHWPRHLHQFTPETLSSQLTNAGFETPRIHYLLHTSHWALSFQNWLQDRAWGRTTLTNGRAWYYPIFLLACVPINFVQKLLGLTGIIGFVAR